jgi:hypothetical protein
VKPDPIVAVCPKANPPRTQWIAGIAARNSLISEGTYPSGVFAHLLHLKGTYRRFPSRLAYPNGVAFGYSFALVDQDFMMPQVNFYANIFGLWGDRKG